MAVLNDVMILLISGRGGVNQSSEQSRSSL
jgi:hypothetical protein